MDGYVTQLRKVLNASCKTIPEENFHTILEMLWYVYSVYFPLDSKNIVKKMEELEDVMNRLPQKKKRRLIAKVEELCMEHERAAFASGIQAGVQLMMELLEEE